MRTYDKASGNLILKNCLGVSQNWWDKSKINYQNSIAQKAIENGRPTIIDNVDSVSYHQGIKLLKSHEFTTMVMIPLFTSEKIIGSLSLYSKDPGKFRLIETDFLLKFAQQCSLALSTKL
jgi:putative methionine-R-sulfoxide reductase with GAF domain